VLDVDFIREHTSGYQELRGEEIIVTLPFTNYTVTYYKPDNSPQLLARKFPRDDDRRAPNTGRVPRSSLEAR
jgi:hypothetical protein